MTVRNFVRAFAIGTVVAGVLGASTVNSYAVTPDPLALPCTIGATTTAVNPYSKKTETYKCEKCGSETCWIVQS